MSNLIQIKRSLTTSTPVSLANGEMAYTANGDVLFIGSNGNIEAIGGKRTPGTLTANQALVANSSSGIDKIITANLVPTAIWDGSSVGSAGQVLTANGTGGWSWEAGAAGSLSGLADTNITSPSDAAVLFYDSATGKWIDNVISGDATVADTGVLTLSTTGVSASSYGDANTVATFTVDAKGRLTAAGTADINHDALLNFVANEHIDHSSVAVTAGSGLTGGGDLTTSRTINVGEGDGITVAADAISVNAGTGVTVNATGVHIGQAVETTSSVTFANVVTTDLTTNGNTVVGSDTNDRITVNALYSSNTIPSANLTYHLGNTTNRWAQVHAGNGHFVTGTFDSNVQIAGDLVVSGNVTTTDVNDLVVSDPLIHLAANNEVSDVVDIGFVGHYSDDGGSTQKHTGFFRDASDNGVYKLFIGSEEAGLDGAGVVVVNTSATGYTTAVLETYLRSSGLTTNATNIGITANSTVQVAIVANTLTLSTALGQTYGGTGKTTMTSQAILVGNTTNGYKELTLGTSGYVLQSNGTALVYDTLDGGTF